MKKMLPMQRLPETDPVFKPKHMMATQAIHMLGDISRDEPDLCYVTSRRGDNYLGSWVTGFGFINVEFPVSTTRDLTEAEIEYYESQHLYINSTYLGKQNVIT